LKQDKESIKRELEAKTIELETAIKEKEKAKFDFETQQNEMKQDYES